MGTLLDLASLVMIPSGVKEDKLYSVKPTDGSGDFTFSRNSDIQATRVNSSGLIEKAKVNNLLYSNDFDTGFSKTRASVVSGQAGYDGTNDAWAFVDTTDNNTHLIVQTIASSEVATFSIYAKKGAVDFIVFRYEDASVEYAFFDLSSGTLGTIDSGYIDAKITSVGGGWYRCEASRTSANKVVILSAETDNEHIYAGTGTTAIYIQDAQLNYGLVAQDYVETTTTSVVEGLTADLPRLDYSGGASCPSLLLEPSRTNFELHSEYLDAATVKDNVTITLNTTTSPEGVDNASSLADNATSGIHRFYSVPSTTAASGATITHSIFAKANSHSWFQLSSGGQTNDQWANFDLTNGVIGNESASANADIQPMGNGWYRCVINSTTSASSALVATIPTLTNDTDSATRSPSYSGSGNGVFVYGLQVELGSYHTSYIPTYGASAQRNEDEAYDLSAADLIGNDEGVIFIDVKMPSEIESNTTFSIGGGTSSEYAQLEIRTDLSINWRYRVGGTDYINANVGSYAAGDRLKIAFAYKNNDSVLYKNGSSIATDTGTIGTNAWDEVRFSNFAGTGNLNASVNETLLFKTRLTNAELAALTTI